jgi:hypothetical protein
VIDTFIGRSSNREPTPPPAERAPGKRLFPRERECVLELCWPEEVAEPAVTRTMSRLEVMP